MALLQVYPWHVDTLMQMSEVYRLQSGTSYLFRPICPIILDPADRALLISRHWRRVRLCRTSLVRSGPMPRAFLRRLVRDVPSRL